MIREALYKITENCPCNCAFCDARKKYDSIFNKTQIKLEDWIKISDDLITNGMEVAIISGGEALLEEKTTFSLIKYLQTNGVYVVLNVSGVLFNNNDILERLKQNYPNLLVFSVDSSDAKQHDDNRSILGLFDRIEKSIKYLKRNQNYPIAIRTVITKQNFRQLPKILEQFNEIGIDCIKFTNIENDIEKKYTLSIEELEEFDTIIRNEMIYTLNKCKFQDENLKKESVLKIKNLLSKENIAYSELSNGIFAPKMVGKTKCDLIERFITIQSNGAVLPCCESEHHYEPVLGNLKEESLNKILSSDVYKNFIYNRPRYCNKCTEWQNIQINFTDMGKKVNQR